MRDLAPLLIILACRIMMIFMMRGMRSGGEVSWPVRGEKGGTVAFSHRPGMRLVS